MNIIRYKTALALGTALIASVAAMPAYAQDATEAVAAAPEDDGEILVTARRREESARAAARGAEPTLPHRARSADEGY